MCGENSDGGSSRGLFLRIHVFLFCTTAAEWGRASCVIGGEKRVSNFNGDVTELHVSAHGSLIVTVSK